MAKRLDMLPLEELYDKDKITPAVQKYILMKEDFTSIQETYCNKVCLLPDGCKEPGKVFQKREPIDVLVVYPFMTPDESNRKGTYIDDKHDTIIRKLAKDHLPDDVTYDTAFMLKCRPKDKKTKLTVVRRCLPYLEEEILRRKPKVVLGMGTDIGKGFGLKKSIRGRVYPLEFKGHKFLLVNSIHPKTLLMIRQNASGQFWGPDYLDILRFDMSKAGKLASGEVEYVPLEESIKRVRDNHIYVAKSVEDVKKFYEYLIGQIHWQGKKQDVVVTWDTETTSLDPWSEDARFLCHQFAFRDKGGGISSFVIPLWHRENKAYDPNEAWKYVENILTNDKIVKVPHNGAFDLIFTKVTTGVDVNRVDFDTMLLLHSMNSGMQGQYDLKTATSDRLFEEQLAGYDDMLVLNDLEDEEEENEENVPPEN